MLPTKTRQDLDLARKEVEWIDDQDLRDLESRSQVGSALLGLFTWGGGRLMAGDLARGIGGIAALVVWMALASVLPGGLITAGYWIGGALGAAWAVQGTRARNRFCAIRNELLLTERSGAAQHLLPAGPQPALGNLGAPPSPAPSAPANGPHASLIDRLRKLASLRKAGVIDDSEHKSRKIDVLSEAASAIPSADLEDLMFALLPLRNEGVLVTEDFDLMKELGGGQP